MLATLTTPGPLTEADLQPFQDAALEGVDEVAGLVFDATVSLRRAVSLATARGYMLPAEFSQALHKLITCADTEIYDPATTTLCVWGCGRPATGRGRFDGLCTACTEDLLLAEGRI